MVFRITEKKSLNTSRFFTVGNESPLTEISERLKKFRREHNNNIPPKTR
jgi:hypothetical protein